MSIWKRLGRVGAGKVKVWGQNASDAVTDLFTGDAPADREALEQELADLEAASRSSKRTGAAPADLTQETPTVEDESVDEHGFKQYKPKKRTL